MFGSPDPPCRVRSRVVALNATVPDGIITNVKRGRVTLDSVTESATAPYRRRRVFMTARSDWGTAFVASDPNTSELPIAVPTKVAS